MFVPEDPTDIPNYISRNQVWFEEAEPDESWDYDEENIQCFSLCIPTSGEMHSDKGILARIKSLEEYIKVLKRLVVKLDSNKCYKKQ
ncbi:hypothetical protein P261_02364 [Lachnospiraceae bacterium TWA4]|nr:hypothetical protein P261_02364 [Lachnospiraceae bacterium TWA4]